MKIGDTIKDRFRKIQKKHHVIGDVRGLGPMVGIELVKKDGTPDPDAFTHLCDHAVSEGLIIVNCGPDGNIIRLIPPLVTTLEELSKALDILETGIEKYKG